MRRYWTVILNVLLVVSLTLTGCATTPTGSDSPPPPPAATQPQATNMTDFDSYKPRLNGMAKVEMTIKGSPVIIEINGTDAPVTAGNFVDLVERGVYDGLAFHRVVTDPSPFVAQGGDPEGKDKSIPVSRLGAGGFVDPVSGARREIPLEIKLIGDEKPTYGKGLGRQAGMSGANVKLKHKKGTIAMARSQMPNSASAQFYFSLADLAFLDGDYAVFGKVIQGMDVVEKIQMGDRIDAVKVLEGAENLVK